jgi:glutaredoxin
MKQVTLYWRKNCSLCHKALDVIEQVRERHDFEFRLVDIDHEMDPKDPRHSRFAIGVPVVEIDGRQVFEHTVDADELTRLVSGAG